ncbi:MAG: TolC family protein [Vicinamibacterales bacterium]
MRKWLLGAALALGVSARVEAQTMVTLEEAMARARAGTPAARALASSVAEADARVTQARSGFFPSLDVTESIQRGNQPVFVFSALLSQRRFAAANFDVQTLNHPAPETNIRTAVGITQHVYDAGATRLAVRGAELRRDLATLDQSAGTQDLALSGARAFVRVLKLEAEERASAAAVAAAESDLERTRRRREAELVTDADVLAFEVHLADVRQRHIATGGDLVVARIELAEALGLPLDQTVGLVKPTAAAPPLEPAALAREGLNARSEQRQAELRLRVAENDRHLARAAFLPRVGVEGSWEFNGSTWTEQRSGWLVGATVTLNVFNGFADRARVTEARQAQSRATAEREQIERRIEVEIRGAVARVTAARARETAGRAALSQARESQRIIRDRYDVGVATVTDVLRAAEAVLDAEARATAAEMDVILETVALDRAVGRL